MMHLETFCWEQQCILVWVIHNHTCIDRCQVALHSVSGRLVVSADFELAVMLHRTNPPGRAPAWHAGTKFSLAQHKALLCHTSRPLAIPISVPTPKQSYAPKVGEMQLQA